MITGIGVDIVEVARIKALLRRKDSALRRIFTPAEIKYCQVKKHSSTESFAARFAAKEAFLKAIGTGWGTRQSPKWQEIEVVKNQPPILKLSGKARLICRRLKANQIHLSLTHTRKYAVAVVVLERK